MLGTHTRTFARGYETSTSPSCLAPPMLSSPLITDGSRDATQMKALLLSVGAKEEEGNDCRQQWNQGFLFSVHLLLGSFSMPSLPHTFGAAAAIFCLFSRAIKPRRSSRCTTRGLRAQGSVLPPPPLLVDITPPRDRRVTVTLKQNKFAEKAAKCEKAENL